MQALFRCNVICSTKSPCSIIKLVYDDRNEFIRTMNSLSIVFRLYMYSIFVAHHAQYIICLSTEYIIYITYIKIPLKLSTKQILFWISIQNNCKFNISNNSCLISLISNKYMSCELVVLTMVF